jgi:hypothetical protein
MPILRTLIARIDQLEAKVDGRLEYEKTLEDLRAKQNLIAQRLGMSQGLSEDSRQSPRPRTDKALAEADLQASLDEAYDLLGLPSYGWGGSMSTTVAKATGAVRKAARKS